MAKVTFSVRPDLYSWNGFESADNPHEHEFEASDLKTVAAAEAAGVLVDVKWPGGKPPAGAVESDKDSLKVQEKAMKNGTWQEGNAIQAQLEKEEGN